MQNAFAKHGIDKLAPVERLVKCKFQDNLEFMQWMKRYWDQNFPGGDYNCNERRTSKGGGRSTPAGARPVTLKKPGMPASTGGAAIRNRTPTNPPNAAGGSSLVTIQLQNQVTELQESILGLEKERDFYFSKLRDIELVLQEHGEEVERSEVLQDIQKILYSTEACLLQAILHANSVGGL
ncbi:Microtubule-associated protein RP/EB family member 3 [Neolecta irregularis DAH-3]|uniref:Microtubule-associated protein RP/EB family member 3 n=1 Tax=Neolecta irregularis (strain DAH-3) TaxID=1198029 RepID=A0A1U7LM10_NEOID|nr:Microtubule-associated protein RP/EB family member 3 [Neolecta irregularis DAH-3]|eukprot:OLL23551.1 Microtubule-associated protein RP/EB family member 3 [Neolecta irregularis DAH-3]